MNHRTEFMPSVNKIYDWLTERQKEDDSLEDGDIRIHSRIRDEGYEIIGKVQVESTGRYDALGNERPIANIEEYRPKFDKYLFESIKNEKIRKKFIEYLEDCFDCEKHDCLVSLEIVDIHIGFRVTMTYSIVDNEFKMYHFSAAGAVYTSGHNN